MGRRGAGPEGLLDILHVAAQGVIAGANMVLVDVHPRPEIALCDGLGRAVLVLLVRRFGGDEEGKPVADPAHRGGLLRRRADRLPCRLRRLAVGRDNLFPLLRARIERARRHLTGPSGILEPVDPRLSHLGVERPPKPARGDALGQRPQEALQVFHVLDGSFGEELDRVVLSALTGATVVQVVSALLRHSPKQLGLLRDGLAMWAG